MVLTAINIQRAVVEPAEVLEQVAHTMRAGADSRRDLTLTSRQRMTGIVVGALLVIMFALFVVMNPAYIACCSDDPGKVMLPAVGESWVTAHQANHGDRDIGAKPC
jgi:Flp pilus assembly protein TadB